MSVHDAVFRTSRPANLSRKMLLATVSATAIFAAAPQVYARPLGGSTPTPAPAVAAVAAAQSMAQDAAQAGRNAQTSLRQAAQAILAVQAAQQAARDAGRAAGGATPSGIPNGLRPGGLQQATGPNAAWIGANNPTEAVEGARTKVNITQTQKNAVLTWQTYNVSENTDLRYDQAGNRDWVALNRVLDPNLAPSRILGNINADGTVLVINQSGIVFGSGAQINVGSLIATTLDVGPSSIRRIGGSQQIVPTDIDWRNQNFLQNGLLGYDTSTATALLSDLSPFAQFSAFSVPNPGNFFQPTAIVPNTGTISVAQGASITTGSGGLVLLTAPHLANAGRIAASSGQVILAATDSTLILTPSTGAKSDSVPQFGAAPDANIRGLVPYVQGGQSASGYYAWNQPGGLIEADRGNITLASPTPNFNFSGRSAAYNDGILSATTSVSRNGSITIDGADVRLGAGSRLSILADAGGETIPQDPTSLAAFKPSAIKIGTNASRIEMQSGSVLFAPAANVQFGNSQPLNPTNFPGGQNILIDSGAEINVAGLTDVQVPISQVQIVIDPAKKNELRDSPLYRDGFLNGATIYLDPRRSGVRDDGVAWIGSPLIDANAYYQLVGVSADRLMTKGGNVSFGPSPSTLAQGALQYTPSVVVRDGAVINTSGGWATYQAGTIRSTRLVDRFGHVVDIGDADPNGVYVGVHNGGYTVNHARWGIVEIFSSSLRKDGRYVPEYTEGRDAGTLSAASVALLFDGVLNSQVYPGLRQRTASKTGTGKSAVAGDLRAVQGSNNELPAGGALIVGGLADIQIATAAPTVPDSIFADLPRGQIATDTGNYTAPRTTSVPFIPTERRSTLFLTDDLLSNSGLSQVSLLTPGKVSIDADTKIALNAGGILNVLAGRRIEANGNITIPSGRISFETTFALETGSLNSSNAAKVNLGDFDIAINGDLSVAGRWVNEYTAQPDYVENHAWLDGGSVSIAAASNIIKTFDSTGRTLSVLNSSATRQSYNPVPIDSVQDISGSILVNAASHLDLSGGGRIDRKGAIDLTARGGSLSLRNNTSYYQTATDTQPSGFQVISTINREGAVIQIAPINPDRINARIVIDPASIKAHGFGGGGTFTLVTPEFSLGDKPATTGTVLPFDFFSTAGFANYDITSYKTEITPSTFLPSTFPNGSATTVSGGYNALLATQTITVGAGQTLALTQSVLPNSLTLDQQIALRSLDSGGDVNTIVAPSIPVEAWDQRAVNLRLGGALELHVAQGGRITGAAGSSLTVGGLLNDGTIRIAGGAITQERIVPRIYASGIQGAIDAVGIRALSDVFSVNADGTIDPNAASRYKTSTGAAISNQDLAGTFFSYDGVTRGRPIYKLGVLDQGQAIVLTSGSVTDLSGAVVLDPRAIGRDGPITTGRILGGGTLSALPTQVIGGTPTSPIRASGAIVARPDAVIDLSGASGAFDVATRSPSSLRLGYTSTPLWSDGGALLAGAGGTFTGAVIRAHGGDANARGGTLQVLNPILAQRDPTTPAANVVSSDMIANSGFDTFIATGNLTSIGDVAIKLGRAFLLQPKPFDGLDASNAAIFTPVISTGGAMLIEAPYIALQNSVDLLNPATTGTPGQGTVTFRGGQIDITGSALFDRSVSRAIFDASGDIRLTGVAPWKTTYQGFPNATPTLRGMISVNGDLSLTAAQIYPTTGTSFSITSTAADGTIAIGRSSNATPATPYSAGGNLLIQAAHIVQGGVVRVPFGTLTLGGNSAYQPGSNLATFAPATQSVVLADGSITSVSAGGLSIPYGTTTDTIEWYFTPTGNDRLTAPPTKVLGINGGTIALGAGATIDLTGGGDVYAYEFVPGTGGSRDVLNQFNSDQYSANVVKGVGYQYPDRRQVYAIVPGLSQAPAAAYDPIYSANYADLGSASGVGKRVYLDGGNGLAAGWYTLLPAQYAMLPGGMRVVERTEAKSALPGVSVRQADGTIVVSGRYGDALSGASESRDRLFSVQSQDVVRSYSNIVLTSGNRLAIDTATSNGTAIPRTGLDAGRLVLNPLNSLTIDAMVATAAAPGGRGAQVDITGAKIDIVSSVVGDPANGTVHLTADGLNKLNAESLLIGGVRTDNADGTTNLAVSANSIVVANDAAHPLVAPEIVLAVDDGISGSVASRLILSDGASLIATGILSDDRNGAFIIDGRLTSTVTNGLTSYSAPAQSGIGALIRLANGPERLVQRLRTPTSPTNPGSPAGLDATLTVGNATLRGGAIGFDTSHNVTIASAAQILGQNISLGAGAIAFTNGAASAGTVVITPELQAILSRGDHLTLRSQTSIGFDNGSYSFGAATFDAAALLSRESGAVNLSANRLQLSNAGGAAAAAGSGAGTLNISADELSIGSGVVATPGFGGVNITAAKGIFSAGVGGGLDVGAAGLNIVTPYIGDRSVAGVAPASSTGMTLRTAGAVTISNAGTAAIDIAAVPGIPGSSLVIEGSAVTIAGTRVRATAGSLTVKSAGALALSNGAVLEAPGYSKTFGDAADPKTASAPGGTLSLVALGGGGIVLGDATLSVGGGTGNGGSLKLSAANGMVDFGTAVLNGKGGADGQGGSFSLDTLGAIDLVALNDRVVTNGFTGGFNLRTRTGDIVLGAGQTLKSGSVNLTADGGFVTVGGVIDTSGINGGDIALYGVNGVTLLASAKLDAHADGYAADDTRRAQAGDVTLGTDFLPGRGVLQPDGSFGGVKADSGTIAIASGALIDASAHRPGNRLVRILRSGVVNYAYVQGDQGGIVTLRAPVVTNSSGNRTVNVQVASAGSIVGARAIDLEAFRRWDLAAVAASGLYSGVTNTSGTITLDVAEGLDTANADGTLTTVAGLNFLGDKGQGTVVDFVQNFDVSSAYGNLGGLAGQANFNARPGVELDHTGNITLASNWNLGAGLVNVTGAIAAGLMQTDPVSGQAYVVSGSEASLLANYTSLTYRVGGRPTGAAPIVSLRAGGDLHLKGSVTDGFFQFRDQYDPTYQSALNASSSVFALEGAFYDGASYWDVPTYNANPDAYNNYYPLPFINNCNYICNFIDQPLPASGSGGAAPKIPFNALGNSPAALGSGPGGAGDPLASAVVMPLLPDGRIVASSSFRLLAGAATPSADPMRVAASATGNVIVDAPKPQSMTVPTGAGSVKIGFYVNGGLVGDLFDFGQAGFDTYLQNLFPGLPSDAVISLLYNYDSLPAPLRDFIDQKLAADPNAQARYDGRVDAYGAMEAVLSLPLFAEFLAGHPEGFGAGGGGGGGNVTVKLLPQTMVRTGTGSIRMAAAGNVDLTGGSAATYINSNGTVASAPNGAQLGSAAVYTAGHPAASLSEVLRDPVTGVAVMVSAPAPTTSIFSAPPAFNYGNPAPNQQADVVGIVIADTVRLAGGGNVEVTAQGSVLGRRDLSLPTRRQNSNNKAYPWVGSTAQLNFNSLGGASDDQPWRVNAVSTDATSASINPQLFRDGIGALGGGDIRIAAGGTVSDITAVSDTSLITATATPAGGAATKVLVTLGGGDVAVRAGGDILAARIDAPSGTALLAAGGRIGGLQVQTGTNSFQYRDPSGAYRSVVLPTLVASETLVRIDDATVDLVAGRDIAIQGIRQLDGYYSDRSAFNLVANGSIVISNAAPQSPSIFQQRIGSYAIYPGTFTLAALMGDANLRAFAAPPGYAAPNQNPALAPVEYNFDGPSAILMTPNPTGQLSILAGGNIAPTKIAMLDADPDYLPGLFTRGGNIIVRNPNNIYDTARFQYQFEFPRVFSNTTEGKLETQHNQDTTHAGDAAPAYVYAGGDIGTAVSGVTLSLPKQARVFAGRDIVNMMFFGQNVAGTDITRIVAGRDIIATTTLLPSTSLVSGPYGLTFTTGPTQPVLLGNSFALGGPGDLMVEAGRNMGPFLNSAVIKNISSDDSGGGYFINTVLRFGEGILTVGNNWNPYLPEGGANITALFGVGKGANYDALRDAYVTPGTPGDAMGGYATKLVAWMQTNAADVLSTKFGTRDVTEQQAYDAFISLPALRQRLFLINDVYFNELRAPAVKDGPSYLVYSRGYAAVNTLFPASLGYTANSLQGGANDGSIVHTGDLDLRLSAIETLNGGDISILGPGGRVLAGSVVSTAQQAARRNSVGYGLHSPQTNAGVSAASRIAPIDSIPPGYEGVITQRGGAINTFTDGDFLLNQSRLFTVKGGDITMWSSNADLNAGQGAKTTPNFPAVEIRIGKNLFAEVDQANATSGAGIAALPPGVDAEPPDVYLLAPRGAVDAGDAGVRSAGDLSVAALRVVNADNFKVGGATTGIPTVQAPNVTGLTEASNTAGAAAKQATAPAQESGNVQASIIIVEVLGFGGGDGEDLRRRDDDKRRSSLSGQTYDPGSSFQVIGNGALTKEQQRKLTDDERKKMSGVQ